MTVAELIARLSEFPAESRVIVNGYEGGYEDVVTAEELPIVLNVNKENYYGPHDDVTSRNGPADEVAILIC